MRSFRKKYFPQRNDGNIELAHVIRYFERNIDQFFTSDGRECFINYLFDFIEFERFESHPNDPISLTTLIDFELKAGDHSPFRHRLFNLLSVVRDLALQNGSVDVIIFLFELDAAFAEIFESKKIIDPSHYEAIQNKGTRPLQIGCGLHFLKLFEAVIDWRFVNLLFSLLATVQAETGYYFEKSTLRKISEFNKSKIAKLLATASIHERTLYLKNCFACFELELIDPVEFEEQTMQITSGKIRFNILSGELFIGGLPMRSVPEAIQSVEILKCLNKGKNVLDFCATPTGFISHSARISMHYLHRSDTKSNSSPQTFFKLGIVIDQEKMLERISGFSANFDKKNLEKFNRFLYCSAKTSLARILETSLDLMRAIPDYLTDALGRYEHWLGLARTGVPSMFIIDHKQQRILKVVFKTDELSIVNLNTNEQLVNSNRGSTYGQSPLAPFRDMIDKALVWKDEADTISSIEFPRFGLNFDYKDKNEFREYPGYSLCYGEECPIPNMTSLIYLKDQKGNELVIMPRDGFLLTSEIESIVYQLRLNETAKPFATHYAFFRKTSDQYFSGNSEALLDLVNCMILSFNYDHALEYLKRSFNSVKFSEFYVKLLNALLDLNRYSVHSTELYAILMHMVYMQIELTEGTNKFSLQAMLIYKHYIEHYNHLKYRLSCSQEFAIGRYFQKISKEEPNNALIQEFSKFVQGNHLKYLMNKDAPWNPNACANSDKEEFLWRPTIFENALKPFQETRLDLGITASPRELEPLKGRESLVSDSFHPNHWDHWKNHFAAHLITGIEGNDRKRLWALRFTLFKALYGFAKNPSKDPRLDKKNSVNHFICMAMLLLTESFLDPDFYEAKKAEFLKLIGSTGEKVTKLGAVIDHYWIELREKLKTKRASQNRSVNATRNRIQNSAYSIFATDVKLLQAMPDTPSLWPRISLNVNKFNRADRHFSEKMFPGPDEKNAPLEESKSVEEFIAEPVVKKIKMSSFEGEADYEIFEELVAHYFLLTKPEPLEFPIGEAGLSGGTLKLPLFKTIVEEQRLEFLTYQINKQRFLLRGDCSIEELKLEIERSIESFLEQSNHLKKLIEKELVRLSTFELTPNEALAFEILNDKATVTGLTIDDAVDWYAFSKPPESVGLQNFYNLTADFVIAKNRIQMLKQALIKISEHKLCEGAERLRLEHELAQMLKSPLFFSKVMMHPIVLYFQYKTGWLLRPKQLEFFSRAVRSTKDVFQLGCGEGKTKVLTMLMSLYFSSQNRQVITIVPSANFTTNYSDLQEQYLAITGGFVTVLQLSRHHALTPENMDEYWNKICDCQSNHGIIISEPQTLQSLQLKYLEYLHKETLSEGKTPEPFFKTYDEILKRFIDQGVAIVDEVHQVLEPLKDLNYSMEDAEVLPAYQFEFPGVMLILASRVITEHRLILAGHNPVSRAVFIDKLAEKIAEKRSHFGLRYEGQDLALFLACLKFNRMKVDPDSEALRNNLVTWYENLDDVTRNKVLLLRAHLHVYLPHCMSLSCYVDYGRSHDPKVKVAVPYIANMKPAVNSHFECVETLVNCTYLLYFKQGLTLTQITELIHYWQRVDREMRLNGAFTLETSISLKFSKKWNNQPLKSIDLSNPLLMQELHKVFTKDLDACLEYVREFVFSGFNAQKYKLSANAQDLGRTLFSTVIGFSGTPSNFLTYPVEMQLHRDVEANGEMFEFLTNREVCQLEFCQRIIVSELPKDKDVSLILDPAALLRGVSNEIVAANLLTGSSSKILAVVYFDSGSNKMMLRFKDGTCKEFQENFCAPDERITYLDQEHVTGVDISQPLNGVGVLIIDRGLKVTDLFQSAKRLRGLGMGQKIQLLLPLPLCDEIKQETGHREITQETVILWSLINEVTELSRTILPALLGQIHNIYRTKAFKHILNLDGIGVKSNAFQQYNQLLMTKLNHEEFRHQGGLFPFESPLTIVMKTLKEYETTYAALLDDQMRKTLIAVLERAKQLLPEAVADAFERSLDARAQQEHEQSSEIQTESQIEKEKLAYQEIRWVPAPQIELLVAEKVSPGLSFRPFSPINFCPVYCEALNVPFAEVGFSPRIFMTQNFLSKIPKNSSKGLFLSDTPGGYDLFLRELPKVQFFAVVSDVARGVDFANYWILSDQEAAVFRERLLNRKIHLLETQKISLYDTRGDLWGASTPKLNHLQHVAVLTQLQFLNGETQFSEQGEKHLLEWITKATAIQKLNFFHRRRRLMKNRELLPRFQGSVLERVFNKKS